MALARSFSSSLVSRIRVRFPPRLIWVRLRFDKQLSVFDSCWGKTKVSDFITLTSNSKFIVLNLWLIGSFGFRSRSSFVWKLILFLLSLVLNWFCRWWIFGVCVYMNSSLPISRFPDIVTTWYTWFCFCTALNSNLSPDLCHIVLGIE